MKKEIAIIGLILIFAGIISAGSARLPVTNVHEITSANVTNALEISDHFEKGENISVVYDWRISLAEDTTEDLPANVTITVNNNVTKLQVLFKMRPIGTYEIPPGEEVAIPVDVSEVRLLQADPDSLYVSDPPRQVGGITQQEGVYTIRIIFDKIPYEPFYEPWWAWDFAPGGAEPNPPDSTSITKYNTVLTYPYTILGPFGAVSVVAGVGLGILGTKLPSARKRMKSKHKSGRIKVSRRNHKP